MNRSLLQPIRPLFLVFILVNALALTAKSLLEKYHFNQELLILGNLLLFVVILVSYLITYRSLHSSNSQAFIRAMYGSFLIKFFILAIAASQAKLIDWPCVHCCISSIRPSRSGP